MSGDQVDDVVAVEQLVAERPDDELRGVILCGRGKPTAADLAAVAEFARFLRDRPAAP